MTTEERAVLVGEVSRVLSHFNMHPNHRGRAAEAVVDEIISKILVAAKKGKKK